MLLALYAPCDLNLISAGSLRYVDEYRGIAFPFYEQLIALLDSSSVKVKHRFASRLRSVSFTKGPTSFSSSPSSARSSSLEALRARTFSGEAGVLSSSTGSALMLSAEMINSGFPVPMGDTTWSLEAAMAVAR